MPRSKRVPYTAVGPFVVRRRFLYSGEWLIPGTAFDHESCGQRRTRQLWDNRQLDIGEPTVIEPDISSDKFIEARLDKMAEWRAMGRVELIKFVEDNFGVKCTSKKNAIEFMEEREGNN